MVKSTTLQIQIQVQAAVKAAKAAGEFDKNDAYSVLLFMPQLRVEDLNADEVRYAENLVRNS